MKRFLVFYGHDYYPAGGWADFDSDFDEQQLASEHAKTMIEKSRSDYEWWHIVDSETGKVVEFHRHNGIV